MSLAKSRREVASFLDKSRNKVLSYLGKSRNKVESYPGNSQAGIVFAQDHTRCNNFVALYQITVLYGGCHFVRVFPGALGYVVASIWLHLISLVTVD